MSKASSPDKSFYSRHFQATTEIPQASPLSNQNRFQTNEQTDIIDSSDGESISVPQEQEAEAATKDILTRKYSLSELVACLNKGYDTTMLPPELYRRVLDFRLAQRKRFEKYGTTKKWGIYGVYKHLINIRTDLEWAEDAAWRRIHEQPYLSWADFERLKQRHVRPWFTFGLIGLCSIMLFIEFALNGWKVQSLKENPLIGPSAQTLINMGALDTAKIVDEKQWFRLFSPIILHAGIVHWAVNMGALYFFGGAIEQSHGLYNGILLFLVPAVGGNLLSSILLTQYISVGASGGIFGCMGACLSDMFIHWNLLFLDDYNGTDETEAANTTKKRNFWALFWLVTEVIVNILIGLTPYVNNFIHLGGFFYGILCGWSVIEYAALNFLGYNATAWFKLRRFTIRFLGLIVSAILIIITVTCLATLDMSKNPCPNCRYFNCVPFPSAAHPWWHCDDCAFVSGDLYHVQGANGTSYYSHVALTCPDGKEIQQIDLTYKVTDEQVVVDQLPTLCREHCKNLYHWSS